MKTSPLMGLEELKKGAEHTSKGTRRVGLPGVKTDAVTMDRAAYNKNRKLAKKITAAYKSLKPGDKDGPQWVLGWRLYPNKDHPAWKKTRKDHFCGCGCGGFSGPTASPKRARKNRKKAKKAKA